MSAETQGAVLDVDRLARVFTPDFYHRLAAAIENGEGDDITADEVARLTAEMVAADYEALG